MSVDKMQLMDSRLSIALWIVFCVLSSQVIYNVGQEIISENPCPEPPPTPMSASMDFVFAVMRYMNQPFYVPMGSKSMYRSYAEYLLGRPPKSQDEIDEMNLRISASPTMTLVTTGFSDRFMQQCVPAFSFTRVYCFAGLGSGSTNLHPVRRATNTLVWSDNKTAALIARCVLGFHNDWQVLSTNPTLDDPTKLIILNKIKEMGFNTSLATLAKYK